MKIYNDLVEKVNELILNEKVIKNSIKEIHEIYSKKRGTLQITTSGLTTAFHRSYPNNDRNRRHSLSKHEEQAIIYVLQRETITINQTLNVSKSFVDKFLKKHAPEFSGRRVKRLTKKRVTEQMKEDVEHFIEKFQILVDLHLVTQKNLLNYDEARIA